MYTRVQEVFTLLREKQIYVGGYSVLSIKT